MFISLTDGIYSNKTWSQNVRQILHEHYSNWISWILLKCSQSFGARHKWDLVSLCNSISYFIYNLFYQLTPLIFLHLLFWNQSALSLKINLFPFFFIPLHYCLLMLESGLKVCIHCALINISTLLFISSML